MTYPPLRHLYVNPAGECNLACRHCWVSPSKNPGDPFTDRKRLKDEFSPERFGRLLEEAIELGLEHVKFTGSEPLLRSDFPRLYSIASSSPNNLIIDVETNGTLVPRGLWDAFGEKWPRSVAVSLDSTDPSIHDSFRGTRGAWKKTVSFIRELVQRKINTQVIMSLSDLAPEPVIDMAELCMKLGVGSLKLNPVQPMGRARDLMDGGIRVDDLLEFSARIFDSCGKAVSIQLPHALLPLDRLKDAGSCPILNLLGILPNGDISFCGIGFSCDELVMGNFQKDDLKDIWKNHPLLLEIRNGLPDQLSGICGNCIHRRSCMGSCVMQNYYLTGRITDPNHICREADETGLFPSSRKVNPDG
jgi:SynChlorMet cassette radical SAM/SPASM protein ScmF